ncbi:MAG: phosphoribosylformylglycinamidine synthase subunit PurQ [Hyphomicrobiaceae bacterium]|nr:phosphoribosylformylglycinamidine synthase subunit PurQ [Hyphomicrobiaceae bacterium]
MKASVIVFPASNCDRDVAVALEAVSGKAPAMIWHGDKDVPDCDLIVLPGGFSYGDYLRSGALAAHSPVMRSVIERANAGVPVLGICNGFQVLAESGLLPGVLMRNAGLKFICKDVHLKVERNDTLFASAYKKGSTIKVPVAHHDGNFFADEDTLKMIEDENRVAFRYCNEKGQVSDASNINGSRNNIAGVYDKTGKILGMMPHPERMIAPELGGVEGLPLFRSILDRLH